MLTFASEARVDSHKRLVRRVRLLVLAVTLLPALLAAAPFRLTQGANGWDVGYVARLLSYDVMAAPGDPGGLVTVSPDADSPWDDATGTLYDGLLHFYRILEKGQDIADWYGYNRFNDSSAAFGFVSSDTTRVFLYMDNTSGRLSLVVVHDQPNDGGGGVANWDFTGLPATSGLDVQDEPGTGDNYVFDPAAGTLHVDWQWLICCTDGVAIGGLEQQSWTITVTPSFGFYDGGTITAMEFLDGDWSTPRSIPLVTTEPFTIATTGEPYGPHRVTLGVVDARGPEIPRLSWPDLDRAWVAVDAARSTVRVYPECATADGFARATARITPKDSAGDRLGSGHSVSPSATSITPGWYDGPVEDRINGHYTAPVVSDTLGTGTVRAWVEGTSLLETDSIRFVGSVPTAEFTHDGPGRAGITVCFRSTSSGGSLPYLYWWDLDGDGSVDANLSNPCHLFDTPGEYWPVLQIVDNRGCVSRKTLSLEILP